MSTAFNFMALTATAFGEFPSDQIVLYRATGDESLKGQPWVVVVYKLKIIR